MEAGPTLIVNYIPDAWTEAKLASHFAVYAPVSVKLCRDRATGRSLGYGFIQFGLDSADAAHAAIAEVNGRPAEHKRLKVTLAKPREEVKLNTNVSAASYTKGPTLPRSPAPNHCIPCVRAGLYLRLTSLFH